MCFYLSDAFEIEGDEQSDIMIIIVEVASMTERFRPKGGMEGPKRTFQEKEPTVPRLTGGQNKSARATKKGLPKGDLFEVASGFEPL